MIEKTIGTRDAYKLYKQEVSKSKSLKIYLDISQGFNKFLIEKLLAGNEIGLPEALGRMRFIGHKTKPRLDEKGFVKGLAPNWKATNELWAKNPVAKEDKTILYYFNEHSDGIRYRLHWAKKNVYVKNKDFFNFKLSRANKHRFKDAINEDKEFNIESCKEYRYVNT